MSTRDLVRVAEGEGHALIAELFLSFVTRFFLVLCGCIYEGDGRMVLQEGLYFAQVLDDIV